MGLAKLIKSMKSELLVTPIHEAWLGQNSNVELNDEVAAWVAREVQAKQRKRSATWSSSSLGYCQRKHIYQFLGVPRERGVNTDLASIFLHGTWTHIKWQTMGFMAGWLAATEVSCAIPGLNYTGTIDGILTTGDGWEFKSINSRGFKWVCDKGPKEEHIRQIYGYMLATNIRRWSLIYENKDNQEYREFVIVFDEAKAAEVLAELVALNKAVETKTLPPMLPGCTTKSTSEYRQCPFRDTCGEGRWPRRKLVINRVRDTPELSSAGEREQDHPRGEG